MQMVMQRGFTWRGSHDNLFGFAKSVTAGRLAKESWLQRLHVKPLIARIQIEFLCGINEFIYCNTLHFFLAKNSRGDQQMVTGLYSFVSSLLLNIPINRLLGKKK
ncbi:hypothetical protein SAMN02745208_02906 [Heyndrickxia coagulans DSM 1 = ATCC 7050]|uniref:Uncharacterized protein n=1 Tax=Heyndrickxia coagulans DSM 1 = ATCC 7050 TaxID=1121088 RepID=A0A8B4C0X8_HEYCO|nr:hypothetical protein SAMN02745208_02906 [Heyndrickxia coagulans DSM 1 = ATCC 7050]